MSQSVGGVEVVAKNQFYCQGLRPDLHEEHLDTDVAA